jgi:Sec-independent protein translocase protein TatA
MGDFSFAHLVLLVIVGIIVYGKDLPQAARKLAIMYNKFRRQLADIKDEIQRQIPMEEIKSELNKVESSLDPMSMQVEIPLPPTSVFAQIVDTARVIVTWNSVPGATTYNLKRSTSSTDPLLIVAMGLTDLSYTDSGLEPGKTYHYVVTAQNSAGESGSSEEGIVTLPAEITPASTEGSAPPTPAPPAEPAPQAAAPSPAPTTPGNEGAPGNGAPQEPAGKVEEPPAA